MEFKNFLILIQICGSQDVTLSRLTSSMCLVQITKYQDDKKRVVCTENTVLVYVQESISSY